MPPLPHLTQLSINALWPWMFFEAHSTTLGFVNIAAQLAIIFLTIWLFFRPTALLVGASLPLRSGFVCEFVKCIAVVVE